MLIQCKTSSAFKDEEQEFTNIPKQLIARFPGIILQVKIRMIMKGLGVILMCY